MKRFFEYLYYRFYCFSEKYYSSGPGANAMALWAIYVWGTIGVIGISVYNVLYPYTDIPDLICGIYYFVMTVQSFYMDLKYSKDKFRNILIERWENEPPHLRKIRGAFIIIYPLFEVFFLFFMHKLIYGAWAGH